MSRYNRVKVLLRSILLGKVLIDLLAQELRERYINVFQDC